MGVAHVSVQMYKYMFKLPIFICDLGDLDCIFGMDAGKTTSFITCSQTGIIWFNANDLGEPEHLSRSSCNAICHLRAVKRNELKPFKVAISEVAYANRVMSKHWTGSQVHCIVHSSLWADLGIIMMDGMDHLNSGSTELDFINITLRLVIIKPGQIMATAIQIDSVEMLTDIELDNDKSIPSAESVFSCVKKWMTSYIPTSFLTK